MINFPANPSPNQTHTAAGRTWVWNGSRWILYSSTSNISISTAYIPESGNLYFTNARVIAALTAGQNITIEANGLIVSAALAFTGNTTNVPEGSNLYYTNARAYANVIGLIPNISGKANITDLTTSNVIEGSNLYYTNARVYSAIASNLFGKANVSDLNTSNTVEGSNLYYTNARVYANVIGLIPNVALKANIADLTSSNVIEGSNLYYTNARVYANVIGLIPDITNKANIADLNSKANIADLTTSNIAEGSNLYYTNARVYANVIGLIPNITNKANTADLNTSNVAEGANLYYTNARVYANVIGLIPNVALKANITDLTTSNVIEGSNLYFTNARAIAALTGGQNITIEANGLVVGVAQSFTGNTNAVPEGSSNLYYTNARVYANVIGLIPNISGKANITDLNTSNIVEGSNLYYTNARVYANVIGLIPNLSQYATILYVNNTVSNSIANIVGSAPAALDTLYELANALGNDSVFSTTVLNNIANSASNVYVQNQLQLKANVTDLNTSNIVEGGNLYYTNARVYANVIGLIPNIAGKANVTDLNTSNVVEGSNLYFTNTRVYANVIGLIPNVALKANIVDLTTSNVIEGSNLYYTNARVYANVIGLIPNVAIKANISDLTTSNVTEGSNLYYTNTRVYANVIGLIPNVALKANIADLTTSNVIEGSNLYYTNSRVYAAVEGNLLLKANVTDLNTSNIVEGSNLYYTNARVYAAIEGNLLLKANVTDLTTSNVIEGSNLYYTNARVYANVIGLIPNVALKANIADLTSSNVIEGSNLYFTNTRAVGALTAGQNITIAANGLITGASQPFTGDTTNVPEGSNLYYTNARVYANVIGLIPNISIKANITDLNTSNIVEGSNLYYNNARVYANVIGLLNTKANITDLTTSNVIEGSNLYYTNARVYANVIGLLNTKANVTDLNTSNIVEGSNLYFTNARVYSNVIGLINAKANIADLTTSNVVEGSNLYFTNARSVGALTAGQNITIAANGLILSQTDYNSLNNKPFIGIVTTDEESNINVVVEVETVEGANSFVARVPAGIIDNYFEIGTHILINGFEYTVTGIANVNSAVSSVNVFPQIDAVYPANTYVFKFENYGEVDRIRFGRGFEFEEIVGNVAKIRVGTVISTEVQGLDTSNIVEGSNLFYTNARVYAAVDGNLLLKANVTDLNTSNIVEGSNLYFTNARVLAAVQQQTVSLNTITANLITANIISANLKGGNLNTIVYQSSANVTNFIDGPNTSATYLTYYANTGIGWSPIPSSNTITYLANSIALTNGVYISGNVMSIQTYGDYVTGSTNYYNFTDGTGTGPAWILNVDFIDVVDFNRIVLNISYTVNSGHTIYVELYNYASSSWDAFGSYNGLTGYYNFALAATSSTNYISAGRTQLRLYHSNQGNASHESRIDYIALEKSTQGPQGPKGLTGSTGNTGPAGPGVATGGNVGQVLSKVSSNNYDTTWIILDTGNVTEGANLYYTNARVYSNVIGLLNTKANTTDLTTTNVIEGANLYYTNARVYSNVIGLLNAKANTADLNTSNIVEGSNLYYSNDRVYANIISTLLAGNITINQLSVTSNLKIYGNVTTYGANNLSLGDNMIYLNSNSTASNPDLGFAGNYNDGTYHHAGFFRDASDGGAWKVFENYQPEPDANVFINTEHASFRLADFKANTITANSFVGNIVYANVIGVISSIENFTTSNLAEGSNLYYSNARVFANIIGIVETKANVSDLTTSNIIEGSNLYYTNARVYANVLGLLNAKANTTDLTTSNVIEGSNLYYTNARVYANVVGLLNTKANTADLNTSNVVEGSNLYYTNARVYANVIGLIPNIAGKANITDLTTSNVIEGSNLYYTNARVYANVIGLIPNISGKANVTDLTTSNVIEGSNLYYSNDRVYANVIGLIPNVTGKANVTDLNTSNVVEGSNLYYTNARVYANVIGLIPNIAGKANITDLTTTNVIEGANLYFTNTRAIGALTAGQNIIIEANGLIVSTATGGGGGGGGANVYFQNTKPTIGISGDVWIDSDSGNYYTYFNDGTSSQWAEMVASNNFSIGDQSTSFSNLTVGGNVIVTYQPATTIGAGIQISAANTQGGTGYADFLKVTNTSGGATNSNKSFRLSSAGALEIINSAYSATLLSLSDAGAMTTALPYQVAGKQTVNGPAFSAYAEATLQTIPNSSLTKVLFQTEEFDTNSNYASSRFTPTVEGYYQLNAEVRLDGASGTGEMMIVLYKNGAAYKRGTNQQGTQIAANFWAMQVSSVVYANGTGDYFEIYVQQGSGGTVSVTAVNSPAITWFNGCMLRGA